MNTIHSTRDHLDHCDGRENHCDDNGAEQQNTCNLEQDICGELKHDGSTSLSWLRVGLRFVRRFPRRALQKRIRVSGGKGRKDPLGLLRGATSTSSGDSSSNKAPWVICSLPGVYPVQTRGQILKPGGSPTRTANLAGDPLWRRGRGDMAFTVEHKTRANGRRAAKACP